MTEEKCPACGKELEDADTEDHDNDFFCINCGGLFTEEEVLQE